MADIQPVRNWSDSNNREISVVHLQCGWLWMSSSFYVFSFLCLWMKYSQHKSNFNISQSFDPCCCYFSPFLFVYVFFSKIASIFIWYGKYSSYYTHHMSMNTVSLAHRAVQYCHIYSHSNKLFEKAGEECFLASTWMFDQYFSRFSHAGQHHRSFLLHLIHAARADIMSNIMK